MKKISLLILVLGIAIGMFFFLGKGTVLNPAEPIQIDGAYIRTNGPGAMAGAAYMVIHNQSGQDDRLISAQTDVAGMAELHSNSLDANGVMSMRPIEGGIALPKDGEAVLARAGNHIMLMGLKQALSEGQDVTMTLTFEKAGAVMVQMPVDSSR
jgi:copper(I)-binding protein